MPGLQNSLDRPLAHVLDRAHAEADRGRLSVTIRVLAILNSEIDARSVDIGREHAHAYAAALLNQMTDLLSVVALDGQERGHVLDRIIRPQVGGLAGEDGVVGAVCFVEAIPSKILNIAKDRFGCFTR